MGQYWSERLQKVSARVTRSRNAEQGLQGTAVVESKQVVKAKRQACPNSCQGSSKQTDDESRDNKQVLRAHSRTRCVVTKSLESRD